VPIAASAIIVWMLWTLAWSELAAAVALVAVSAVAYAIQQRRRRTAATVASLTVQV